MSLIGTIKQNIPEIEDGIAVLNEKTAAFLDAGTSHAVPALGDDSESMGKCVDAVREIDLSIHQSLMAWGGLVNTISEFVSADLTRFLEADGQ